jgi:DNA-binding response OmpR family regulator
MKTIVIIDDEFGLADVLAAALSDVGFRVHTASNGVQGLAIVAEYLPDLVILDYMMPLLDGSSVLRTMKADERFADIPVLMMSSLPEPAIQVRCSGYVAFLRKPFDFDAVLSAIGRATASSPPATRSQDR